MKKKLVATLTLLLSASMVFVGCGSSNETNAPTETQDKQEAPVVEEKPQQEEKKEEKEKPQQEVTLNFMGWKAGKEAGAIPDLIAKFESENPGIKVDYETIPTSNGYEDVLKSRLATGDGPDVFMTSSGSSKLFADAGYLADLSGQEWVDTVQDNIAKLCEFEDKTYVLPIEASGLGMITNMSLLKEVGIEELPSNWGELMDASEKLKSAGKIPFTFGNKTGWSGGVILGFGISTEYNDFDNDIYTRLFEGDASYKDLYGNALVKYQEILDKEYANNKESLGMEFNDAAVSEFAKGESGFLIAGTWMIQELCDLLEGKEVLFSPFPINDEDPAIAELSVSVTLACNAESKNVDVAKKFVDFWSKDENLKEYVNSQNAFTTLKGGTSMELPAAKPFADTLAANNGSVGAKWDDRIKVDGWGILTKQVQLMTLGESTPETVWTELDEALEQSKLLQGQ